MRKRAISAVAKAAVLTLRLVMKQSLNQVVKRVVPAVKIKAPQHAAAQSYQNQLTPLLLWPATKREWTN
jgi:hypothetical protein